MPTKNRYSSANRKPLRNRKIFWVVVLMAMVATSGFATQAFSSYKHKQDVAADRARFAQAEKDLELMAEGIIAATGTPVKVANDKGCSKPSTKWEKSVLRCYTGKKLFFTVSDNEQANIIRAVSQEQIVKHWEVSNINYSTNIRNVERFTILDESSYDKLTGYQIVDYELNKKDNTIPCSASYTQYLNSLPPYNSYFLSSNTKYSLVADIQCRDKATVEHYPIRN